MIFFCNLLEGGDCGEFLWAGHIIIVFEYMHAWKGKLGWRYL